VSTLHTIDARGCSIHSTRASGSPIVTVRGVPLRSGAVSWRLPSLAAMSAAADAHALAGERLDYVSHRDAARDGTPAIRTYIARTN
jgi:hypothetical protein